MKRKIIIGILTLSCLLSLSSCGKKDNIDTNDLNNGINNLISSLPNEDIKEEAKSNDLQVEEFENTTETSTTEELSKEDLEQIEEVQDFAQSIKKMSEDVIPKELNFSFVSYSAYDVPETFEYLGALWQTKVVDYVDASKFGTQNPSISMTTIFPYSNDEEKAKVSSIYENVMTNLLSLYGDIIGGINYETLSFDDINSDNESAMLFECGDCYIVVTSQSYEEETDYKGVTLGVYFVAKNLYHDRNGEEYSILEFIESIVPNPNIKYCYQNQSGEYYEANSKAASTQMAIDKY